VEIRQCVEIDETRRNQRLAADVRDIDLAGKIMPDENDMRVLIGDFTSFDQAVTAVLVAHHPVRSQARAHRALRAAMAAAQRRQDTDVIPLFAAIDRLLDASHAFGCENGAGKLAKLVAQFRFREWTLEVTPVAVARMCCAAPVGEENRYAGRAEPRS